MGTRGDVNCVGVVALPFVRFAKLYGQFISSRESICVSIGTWVEVECVRSIRGRLLSHRVVTTRAESFLATISTVTRIAAASLNHGLVPCVGGVEILLGEALSVSATVVVGACHTVAALALESILALAKPTLTVAGSLVRALDVCGVVTDPGVAKRTNAVAARGASKTLEAGALIVRGALAV